MTVILGEDAYISPKARINVDYLELGDRTIINDYAHIEGRHIVIGTEGWVDEYAHIGGGSCFDEQSSLDVGCFFHMGKFSELNQARCVTIGNEVGLGMKTVVVSHGAYLSAYDGFPIQWGEVHIGDRVWLPNAWVNPGVTIENDVVVASGSVVTKNLLSGNLYGGVPAKILKEGVYPRKLIDEEKNALFSMIIRDANVEASIDRRGIRCDSAVFNVEERIISGLVSDSTERLKNQLRRNGIRFKYKKENGAYVSW